MYRDIRFQKNINYSKITAQNPNPDEIKLVQIRRNKDTKYRSNISLKTTQANKQANKQRSKQQKQNKQRTETDYANMYT